MTFGAVALAVVVRARLTLDPMKAVTLLLVAGVNISVGQEPKRPCQPADWPKQLPALDAVVDSASLFDLVDTSSAGDTTSIVVSILYKGDGTAAVVLVEPTGVPSPEVAFFLRSLGRGLRRISPPSPLGALRVRLRAGPARAGNIERSVYCPPKPVPTAVGPQSRRFEILPGERPRTGRINVDVQVFIDKTGTVSDVRLISGSGLREFDESIVAEERRAIYLPATIDGVPVPSWTRSNGSTMRL
jgi:TonB family protein